METHQDRKERLINCPYCNKRVCYGRLLNIHLKDRHKELKLTVEQRKEICQRILPNKEENEKIMEADEIRKLNQEGRNETVDDSAIRGGWPI